MYLDLFDVFGIPDSNCLEVLMNLNVKTFFFRIYRFREILLEQCVSKKLTGTVALQRVHCSQETKICMI